MRIVTCSLFSVEFLGGASQHGGDLSLETNCNGRKSGDLEIHLVSIVHARDAPSKISWKIYFMEISVNFKCSCIKLIF